MRSNRNIKSSRMTSSGPRPSSSRTDFRESTAEVRKELEEAEAGFASLDAEQREEHQERVAELDKQLRQAETDVLDELLPEAFAAVREASRRSIGLRHFDVQLIGGAVLHGGTIAEMRTGEGKTLVATLPLYLNTLTARGVHLITVNDYLARRDVQWMGPIYELGVSVAIDRARRELSFRPHLHYKGLPCHSICTRYRGKRPTAPILPTAPITSSASTTCATT